MNSARTQSLIVAALVFLCSSFALADKKADEFKQAQAAVNAGRVDEAARLFCDVAGQDPGYQGGAAQQNCNIYRNLVAGENARNEERFTDGVAFFNRGDYDAAEQKFRAIKTGPHLSEAQDYLSSKIPAARASAQQGAAEAALNQKFNDGVQAYNNNAFSSAKGLFGQVNSGAHQNDAQGYLQKMQQFEQYMQQGNSARDSKNYSAALSAYQQAANIKSDGPGDPGAQLGLVRTLMANTGTPPPPVQQPQQQAQPQPTLAAAVVHANKPKLDVNKLILQAKADIKKGNNGDARAKLLQIMGQEDNAEAQSLYDSLPKDNNQQVGAAADGILSRGLGDFYSGNYESAEVHIGDYIEKNGGKAALAYFFRGVSEITRYYLRGEQPSDRRLLTQGEDDFRAAKKSGNFNPPQGMVSPKIMKIFDQTS